MTNITLHAPAQSPRINGTIISLISSAVVVLAGFLSLAAFAG